MKRALPPAPETAGPRNDYGPREVLELAALIEARQRARLSRLTSAGRLRRWGSR